MSLGQNAQSLPPMGIGQPGGINQLAGSMGGGQALQFRSAHDAALSGMAGFIPSAEYPDGYLGTIQSRREDRLLDSLKGQVNQKSYQRGVHKGERIDAADYFWPAELQDTAGLSRQMQGYVDPATGLYNAPRCAPLGTLAEQMASNGSELPMTPRGKVRTTPDHYTAGPEAVAALRAMAPSWR